MRWVVVTDLDESLLERESYAWEAARPAIDMLKARHVPIVFCTSKTRAEAEHFARQMAIRDPMIVENGGGLFVEDRKIVLGATYEEILDGFAHVKQRAGGAIRGFSDMSAEEISEQTHLPLELARLAKQREFDEPFYFVRDEHALLPDVMHAVREAKLRMTRGGRFYHLHGDSDKGRAVRELKAVLGRGRYIGVGDSEQDLHFLLEVDVPIAIQRASGSHDPTLVANLPRLKCIPRAGPAGWAQAIFEIFGDKS